MIKYKDAHVTFERAMEAVAGKNWNFALQNILAARKAMAKKQKTIGIKIPWVLHR